MDIAGVRTARRRRTGRPRAGAFAVVAALAASTALAACAPSTPDADFRVVAAGVERDAPSAQAAASAGAATTALGTDLFAALGPEGNLVLSPYSVAVALAMTRAGAAGVTAQELDGVLHTDDLEDLHAAFGSLDAVLADRSGEFEVPGEEDPLALELSFGNAVWPQDDFAFEDAFLETLARSYGSGVNVVDYRTESEAAREAINGWVSDQTRDRIGELIPAGVLTTLTRLVLTNAVYLNAPWLHPFDEGLTADGPFTLLDGTTASVPLMRLDEDLAYGAGDDWQAVRLPYVGGNLAMVVLVPDDGAFAAVADELGAGLIDTVGAALGNRPVRLGLPRFEFRTQSNLNDALRTLGMPTAFTDQADFSAMSPEPLAITDVLHEAFISVDEEGTEAAAATAVVVGVTSAPPDPVTLTVDRPYLFWIVDEPTGAVLFLGRVLDPTRD